MTLSQLTSRSGRRSGRPAVRNAWRAATAWERVQLVPEVHPLPGEAVVDAIGTSAFLASPARAHVRPTLARQPRVAGDTLITDAATIATLMRCE
jgi:hypothetical protein